MMAHFNRSSGKGHPDRDTRPGLDAGSGVQVRSHRVKAYDTCPVIGVVRSGESAI